VQMSRMPLRPRLSDPASPQKGAVVPEAELRIRFTGKLVTGANPQDVLNNLCTLLKAEPAKVKGAFSKKDAVVWRGQDRALATRLVAALERAGALCRIEESGEPPPPPPHEAGSAAPGEGPQRSEKEGAATAGEIPEGVVPKLGRMDMSLAPVICHRISAAPNGLATGRKDCPELGFDELLLASAFKCSEEKDDYRLLLFTTRQKRPLMADCSAIAYQEFSGAGEKNMLHSLRSFLRHLRAMQPGLVFDQGSCSFIAGAPPQVYSKEITVLSTALYQAIGMPAPAPRLAPRPAEPAPPSASTAPFYIASRSSSSAKEQDEWSARFSLIFALLLLAGFAWPLLKRSILFGSDQLIWPWQLMGFGMDAAKAASMGTFSIPGNLGSWALVPFTAALLTLIIRSCLSGLRRSLGLLVVGAVSTTLLLTVFLKEAELYGLVMIPPTVAGGILVLLTVSSGALLAATNHVRKGLPAGRLLRALSGVGGVVVLLAGLLAVAGSDWKGWAVYPLYGLMLLVGGLGLVNALKAEPGEGELNLVSLSIRALLAWAPVAAVVTQRYSDNAFVQYVMSADSGTANLAMSAIKCFAIYYGCAFLMALGLAGLIGARLSNQPQPAGATESVPPATGRARRTDPAAP